MSQMVEPVGIQGHRFAEERAYNTFLRFVHLLSLLHYCLKVRVIPENVDIVVLALHSVILA